MTLLSRINKACNPFYRATLSEIAAQRLKEQIELQAQCRNVIRAHQFQEHMASATIEALIAWDSIDRKDKTL